MKEKRKTILYIAVSLDGYIAKHNGDLSFLSIVEQEGQDYGYADFKNTTDTVIMGRKTYDWLLQHVAEFPHADKEVYIITRTFKKGIDNIKFYNGSLKNLMNKLTSQSGKNIFIDGGAEIVNELLKEKLIDEFYISVIPILLGEGLRLFKDELPEQKLELIKSEQYEKGLVQLHYRRN